LPGGGGHGECVEREPKRGSGAELPVGSGGRWGLKPKAFCPFSYKKKWPKVKNLNENLPRRLRQTASRSNDKLQVLVNGEGRPPGTPIAESATV